jgi:hypothetical protein
MAAAHVILRYNMQFAMESGPKLRTAVIVAIALALSISVTPASAHVLDSDLYVNGAPVGPYEVSVWTVASVTEDVSIHLTSSVVQPENKAPLLAAKVNYRIEDMRTPRPVIVSPASVALPTNGFTYESTVQLPQPGSYRITVDVRDSTDTGGEVTFVIAVYPVSIWMKALIYLLLAIGIVMVLWLAREGILIVMKRRRKKHDHDE